MQKSSAIITLILLAGFGGILFAAGKALEPLAEDADVAKALTADLRHRGDLVEGSKVKALRTAGGKKRLASEGRGVLLVLSPSEAIRRRPGGLARLAERAARGALERYPPRRIDWVEITLVMRQDDPAADLKTLLPVGEEGDLLGAVPPLPAVAPGLKVVPRRRPEDGKPAKTG